MANPQTTFTGFNQNINSLIQALENLRTYQDMLAVDATLAGVLATYANTRGWNMSATDVNNAAGAIGQILFAYNSGTPSQASLLYKML